MLLTPIFVLHIKTSFNRRCSGNYGALH